MQGDYFYGNNTDTRTELHRYTNSDVNSCQSTALVEPRSISLFTFGI